MFKVLYSFISTKNTIGAITEVSNIYKTIKQIRSKIFIRYQNCKVFDINTNPCNNCARFGHSGKHCENTAMCHKWAADHIAPKFISDQLKRSKYTFYNIKYKTKYNINNCVMDSQMCKILKYKIKKYVESTDYPLRPTYQGYFSKAKSSCNRHTTEKQMVRKVTTAVYLRVQINN